MREIVAKFVVVIDGKEYVHRICDYSESVEQMINDGELEENNQEILEYVYEDCEF